MTRAELESAVVEFTEAFNHEDLDAVMAWFGDDSVYDTFDGSAARGRAAIRAAFEPQFRGDFGRMRFVTEDLFVDVQAGKALISWLCTLERDGRKRGWRGLDLLVFRDAKVVEKRTYAKAERLKLEALPA